jgi:hypothetical protein
MKGKILISLLTIVLISGCSGISIPGVDLTPGVGVGGNGLEITSFLAEPTSAFSGSTVRVTVEVENKGGTTVPNGGSLIYLTGASFSEWSGGSPAVYKTIDKEMKAEDVVRGVPASTFRWNPTLTAPSLTAGQTNSYILIGRLYSDYKTSANGNIWVYDDTEAEAARAAGKSLYTPSFTYTKGPVGLSITVSPSPIVLYEGESRFTVYIKISNLASGTIYAPGSVSSSDVGLTMDEINRVDVAVTPGTGLSLVTSDGCQGSDQELVAGRDLTMVCDVTVGSVATFQSFPFEVSVSYGYYTERTTSVTVQGKTTTPTPTASCSGTPAACNTFSWSATSSCPSKQKGCTDNTTSDPKCLGTAAGCASRTQAECGSGTNCTWA